MPEGILFPTNYLIKQKKEVVSTPINMELGSYLHILTRGNRNSHLFAHKNILICKKYAFIRFFFYYFSCMDHSSYNLL